MGVIRPKAIIKDVAKAKLFLGNEPICVVHAYRQRIADPTTEHPLPDLKSLASLYQKYGMFEEAKQLLDTAMKHIPGPPWT